MNNLGKTASPEACANMSAAQKGRTLSPEACAKISATLKSKAKSLEARRNMSLAQGGDGEVLNRRYSGLKAWTRLVKETFTCCVVCRSTKSLEAHHIAPKATYPQWATLIFNGVTLCKPCHSSVHYPTSET
jgi:5-methylcytosine-specific restriction endonuclease McrA